MRICIFGDIGGHHVQFMEALSALGVDVQNHAVPKDMVIIQVGDLVHRGPDSDALVEWVDQALTNNKDPETGRWVQLFGNHEGHHVGGPEFNQRYSDGKFAEWELTEASHKILNKWWGSKKAWMAAAVERTDTDEPRDVLISHAGLCRQTWAGIGFPMTARDAAKTLNKQDKKMAFAPGYLLGGYIQGPGGGLVPPGVAWASAAKEVYPSWEGKDCLFDQVHGHSTLWNWKNENWYVEYSIAANIERDYERRFTRWTNSDGRTLTCVDQALGRSAPTRPIAHLEFEGELLVP